MKKNDFHLFATMILLLISSCAGQSRQKFSYVPLDPNLKIDTMADNTPLSIIGFSGGKDSEGEELYYYQFVGVTEAGDTVRVLAPSITVPSGTDTGIIHTSPSGFDPAKGVTNATFHSIDSASTTMLSLLALPQTKIDPAELIRRSVEGPALKEILVINESIPSFDRPGYLTVKGVLHFNEIPW